MGSRSRRLARGIRRLRRRVRAIRLTRREVVLTGLVVVLVLAGGFFSWQATRAVGALQAASDQADALKSDLVKGDVDAARDDLAQLDASTSKAHGSTDGPLWAIGAHVPVLGRNVDAVRTVARALDGVTDDALPAIVDVADAVRLDTFRPKDGRVDLAAVAEAAPVLARADRSFARADEEIAAFDPDGLVGPLRGPMDAVQSQVTASADAASAADDAARLLPSMLGADGRKRTFLLLILNNAEVRSLGGIPGSVAELTTQDGRVEMGRQGSIQDVPPLKKAPIALTDDERIVFQSTVATDMRDTAIDPDFPRAAELAASVVGKRWKEKYDGVVAVDPVALSYLLAGLGAVDIGDAGTINSDNAVATLLNGVYLKYPTKPAKQDDAFENAARRIFDATVDGTGSSPIVIRGLVRAAREQRLLLWSRNDADQRRIESGGISGALQKTPGVPQVGVYVNDNGSTKMEYYLDSNTSVISERCLDRDVQELRTTTTLVSNAPRNAVDLPASVVGPGELVPPGDMALGVMILGPPGGDITSMTVDGRPAPIGGAELDGRPVAKVARELPPGESSVIVTTMRTGVRSPGDPRLRTTPGVTPTADRAGDSACG